MLTEVDEQIKTFIEKRTPVVIHFNDENGDWVYAVSVADKVNDGFWLNAFRTKTQAVLFCERNNLPYKI
jgi:hypothetical protein